MPHVLVAGKIHESGIGLLRSAPDVTVDFVQEVSTEAYAPRIADADAVLIRTQPMPASVIAAAKRLRIVSRHGVGYDAVDVEALNARNIPLTVIGDVNSVSVAEHTMMLMLAVARGTIAYDAATRAGRWAYRDSLDARDLNGRTVLVIGYGRIGRAVSRLSAAFGMSVMVYDPFVDAARVAADGHVALPTLQAGLPVADVVTVHVPMAKDGAVIGARELATLKPGAIVINTARGGLVDEAALTVALADGRLRGVGLDVLVNEPPRADDPLLASDRVVLSPHSAGLTLECAERMAVAAARNILDFFAGRLDPALVVNGPAISSSMRA